MNDGLKRRCDLLVENETTVRHAARLDYQEISKAAALAFTSKGVHASKERIQACRHILKSRAGVLSNLRGIMSTVTLAKMSMAEDPEAYIDEAIGIYKALTTHTLFSYESQAMCALTIHDLCPKDQWDTVVERTMAGYDLARTNHPLITTNSDIPLIALMVMDGQDLEVMASRAEECLELVKPLFKLHPETKQMVSHVLALSDKGPKEKVDTFWSLYLALKDAKLQISRSFMIAILAAYVDLEVPQDELVAEIAEVDEFLRHQKGYGAVMGVGQGFRRMIAAILVLQEHQDELDISRANATSTAIAEIVAEEIVETIIMIVVASTVIASTSSASSN